ncbi:hypothetical protein TURU_055281 [Turdus rufiventris]|nr:hypothetical protein TURU_055281 [Turdus rufiventris]
MIVPSYSSAVIHGDASAIGLIENVKRKLVAETQLVRALNSNEAKQYEYFNAVLINERDEEGNYLELGKEFILVPNDHFNNLPVNISLSDVQVPTNMYNKASVFTSKPFGSAGMALQDVYYALSLLSSSLSLAVDLIWVFPVHLITMTTDFRSTWKREVFPLESPALPLLIQQLLLGYSVGLCLLTDVSQGMFVAEHYLSDLDTPLEMKYRSRTKISVFELALGSSCGLRNRILILVLHISDPAIVNGVYWSESLNKVFVDNFDRDPSLIWQYFGSAKGFFRQYPGIKWEPDENGVIAFDCRNRKWYIQAATSPKDVVILVDVSGSMKGLRLTIAKQTVSSILDTLGDDDFFNIIAYNEELHYVEPCLNGTLVQADRANKEHFREHLDKLFAKGIGMLDIALNEAFNMLNEFNHTGQGSICSQAIMLITDGAVDTYDTIFAKYNWPDRKGEKLTASEYGNLDEFKLTGGTPQCFVNIPKGLTTVPGVTHRSKVSSGQVFLISKGKLCTGPYYSKVRIFTYLIGREAAFADNLKWMACANKGFFTQISTLADVQENVMEYLHVLSRPKVIDQEHDVVWTEAYIDSTLADDQGLVLMTTVAMPVFSKQNETRSKGILLGVVGTDVPVKELLKTIPKYKLGIHGYAFAITNNGYILTHPELRPLKVIESACTAGCGDELPVSNIDRFGLWCSCSCPEGGESTIDIALQYEEGKKRRKPNYSSVDLSEVEWEDRDDVKRVLVMTNDYYYTDIKGTPFSLGVALSRGHGKYFFRGNVTVEEGLHDLEHPDVSLADEWNSDKGVEVAFLGTRTGLSRINLFVGPEQLTNQDFLTAEDKENIFNADHFPLWYRRAAEQIPGSFVYSIPFSTETANKSNVVTASTAIQLLDDRKSPVVAGTNVLV